MRWQSMNSVRKSVSKVSNSLGCRRCKGVALFAISALLGACTALPGPPGDPTKYKRTRVDGPGQLSKVAYGKAEEPRDMPKSAWGNAPTYTVFGKQYSVMGSSRGFREEGIASWYGSKFHGRQTSNGDIYNMYNMTAAHKHLPLPTFVRVTNLENNKQLVVKVNDRGPFVDDRIIDLSYGAAAHLGMLDTGTARVRIVAISENIEKPPLLQAKVPTKATDTISRSATLKTPESPASQPPEQYVEILASAHGTGKQILPGGEVVRQPRQVVRREAAIKVKTHTNPQSVVNAQSVVAAQTPAAVQRQLQPQLQAKPKSQLVAAVNSAGTVIQVGAFGNPDNAEAMRLRVNRAVNDDAAIIIANSTGTLLRVQIGPLPAEAPVERIVGQLKSAGVEEIKLFQL